MAERGWADLTGCPQYVRQAVVAAGIRTRWRARLFAPAWVVRVYRALERVMSPGGELAALWAQDEFTKVLRAVQKDPGAFDTEAALAAYWLGGKDAMLGALGAS